VLTKQDETNDRQQGYLESVQVKLEMQCLQSGKLDLRGETFDGFDQVLIAVPIASEKLAHQRDKVEGILFVHPERAKLSTGMLSAYHALALARWREMPVRAKPDRTGTYSLNKGFWTLPNSKTPNRPPGFSTR
jgi:hypothetical protein